MTPIIIGLFCVAVGVVGSPLPRTHSRHYCKYENNYIIN